LRRSFHGTRHRDRAGRGTPAPGLGASSPPPGLPATEQTPRLNAPFNRFSQLTIDSHDPSVMYWVLDSLGVLKSIDGGATWQSKNDGLPNVAARYLTIHPDDPNHLVLGFLGHSRRRGITLSLLDGGARWEPTVVCEREDGVINLRQQCDATKLLFDPLETNRLYYLIPLPVRGVRRLLPIVRRGLSYDRNPNCIPQTRAAAPARPGPEPVNNFASNDASISRSKSRHRDACTARRGPPEESALDDVAGQGGRWTWRTSSTRPALRRRRRPGTPRASFSRLRPRAVGPEVRYGVLAGPRCNNGKAYPVSFECPSEPEASGSPAR